MLAPEQEELKSAAEKSASVKCRTLHYQEIMACKGVLPILIMGPDVEY
jgi:hypothetical protein